MSSNELLIGLTQAAKIFYDAMIQKLEGGNYPSGDSARGLTSIQEATSVGVPQITSKGGFIDIKISLKLAPYATAYEWGSGLHGKEGALYPIAARNAPQLVFWWENQGKWFVGASLPHGHPGVEARPYIEPTIQATKEEVRKVLGKAFKAEIMAMTPQRQTVIEVQI